jgi:energy-converting hydrogenase Eha subunit E
MRYLAAEVDILGVAVAFFAFVVAAASAAFVATEQLLDLFVVDIEMVDRD